MAKGSTRPPVAWARLADKAIGGLAETAPHGDSWM